MSKESLKEKLEKECAALEKAAGISELIEKAREGSLFPLGAFGEDASPDEYFANEYDHFRARMRDAYFSIPDKNLRKKLILVRRKLDKQSIKSLEDSVVDAQRAVYLAKGKLRRPPWTKATLFATAAVAFGYWQFELPGAIGGAVAGYFIGHGVVSEAKNAAEAELEEAERQLTEMEKEKRDGQSWPGNFNLDEEISGERDASYDGESALFATIDTAKRREN